MPRDASLFLDDILDACRKIRRYTVNVTPDQFRSDEKTVDAVVRNLEVIGEAAKKLPDEFRDQIRDVEWQRIAGLRDILIHEYFGIDVEIIWDIVQNKVPTLELRVEDFLRSL